MAAGKLSTARFEVFQKLEEELEKLRLSRKKRQMTGDRHIRRQQQGKARKYAERSEREHEDEPPRRRD